MEHIFSRNTDLSNGSADHRPEISDASRKRRHHMLILSLSLALCGATTVPCRGQSVRVIERDLGSVVHSLDVKVVGAGLSKVILTIIGRPTSPPVVVIGPNNTTPSRIKRNVQTTRIAILPGTVFRSASAQVQDMVVTARTIITVRDGESATVSVPVACLNMGRREPSQTDSLTYGGMASGALWALINSDGFASAPIDIRQFAVWTLTDNPAKNEYRRIAITSSSMPTLPFGTGGSGPSTEALLRIRDLLLKAGISPNHYRALQGLK